MFGNGTQPRQNAQHLLDDATGRWRKYGRTYSNGEGWLIHRAEPGKWYIVRPDGSAVSSASGRAWMWSSLTVAKLEAERLIGEVTA